MIIKTAQIATIGAPSKERFILLTVEFLKENTPEWAAGKDDVVIGAHVQSMVELLQVRMVLKEVNIQRAIFHQIRYDLQIPFSQAVEEILRYDLGSEDDRMDELVKAIKKHHVK